MFNRLENFRKERLRKRAGLSKHGGGFGWYKPSKRELRLLEKQRLKRAKHFPYEHDFEHRIDKRLLKLIYFQKEKTSLVEVKALVNRGADSNVRFHGRQSMLSFAASCSDEVFEYFLAAEIDVNHQNRFGYTVLTSAILKGSNYKVQRLLDSGARADIVCQLGLNPFMYACQFLYDGNNNPDLLLNFKTILDLDYFDLNHSDYQNGTALKYLQDIPTKNEAVSQLLLDYGAETND